MGGIDADLQSCSQLQSIWPLNAKVWLRAR